MRESKRERFVRLAEARTNKILDQIRLLSNLANKGNYDFSEDDAKKIFTAIEKEIRFAKNSFAGMETNDQRFKLDL